MNSNIIIRRIDQSCDILGGKEKLKEKGFNNIMGFNQIIQQMNEKPFEELWNILKDLILDEDIYKDFAFFVIKNSLLEEKYYELDENLNPTNQNINYRLEKEFNQNTETSEDFISREMKLFENESRTLYESTKQNNQTNININLDSEYQNKIEQLKTKLPPEIINWLKKNIKLLSNEDYGNFMVLMTLFRNEI